MSVFHLTANISDPLHGDPLDAAAARIIVLFIMGGSRGFHRPAAVHRVPELLVRI